MATLNSWLTSLNALVFVCVRRRDRPLFHWLIAWMAALSAIGINHAEATPAFPAWSEWGPTTYSFGGASAANLVNHDSMLNNPAGLAFFADKVSLGGSWQTLPRDQSAWSASIIDGTNLVIGALHFQNFETATSKRQTYTLSGAYRTGYGVVGFSGHVLNYQDVSSGKGWHFTQTMGVMIPAGTYFSIGATSRAFLDFEDDQDLPVSLSLGALFSYPGVLRASFQADRWFEITGQDWNYSTGADLAIVDYFSVRGGYRWDNSQLTGQSAYSFWSLGGALVAPKAEFSAVFIRSVDEPEENGIGVDLHIRF